MFSRFLSRFSSSHTILLGGISVLVGISTGAGVWLFKWLIDLLQHDLFGPLQAAASPAASWISVLIPVGGGLGVGLLAHFFIQQEKLHGTASIMQSVALSGGRMRYAQMPVKTLAATLSIGSGASVGPEDPSVQIGANLGSMFGQWFRMSDDRMRTLVAAGSASAIAAAFNAPIAGVFFALEIVLGQIGGAAPGMILVAAVTSSVFTQAVSGSSPAFQVPPYAFSISELPFYLVLGLLAGPISAIYVRLLYKLQDLYPQVRLPEWLKPASAGLLVGLAGLFLPQVLGVGYGTIGEILNLNDLGLGLLLGLMAAKMILTPISIAGGFFGGVFAPSLFIGATLGGAFGKLLVMSFPGLAINPAAFALVGMAAVLAGAVHAPLTAILLLFEMTSDYRIILPLMFAVAVSLLLSQAIQKDSVYSMGLARHGIRLDRGRDVEVMSSITVGEVMLPETEALTMEMPVDEAARVLARTRHHGMPVLNPQGTLIGILTLQDMEKAAPNSTVGQICTRNLEVAYPDESLSGVLRRMSVRDVGRLPVVDRQNPGKLLGVLRRSDIIHAYDLALTRREALRHREHAIRLDDLTPTRVDVMDMVVNPQSSIVGQRMREIPFPHDCVIASVRRGSRVFIPRGDTLLKAGDVLVVVAEGTARQEVARLCDSQESLGDRI